jgi:hypothetical protein
MVYECCAMFCWVACIIEFVNAIDASIDPHTVCNNFHGSAAPWFSFICMGTFLNSFLAG